MSGAATAAFRAAWGRYDVQRITLVKIDLSVPSARTLRYATQECHTPDGNSWQAGLMGGGTVRAVVDWLSPGLAPVSASIRLAKRRDASQTSGTLHDLLSDFLWQNAVVTLYRWVHDVGLGASDIFQIFKGKVSRPTEVDHEGFTLNLLQDQSWNVQLPPVVDKTNYPDSPDVSQGLPVPIVYGDHSAIRMRSPWTSAFGSKKDQEDSGGGSGVVPLILVDAGVGAASVKVVAAAHLCQDILDRANGLSTFLAGGDVLHPLDTAGITETLGASESSLSFADETVIAFAPVIPIDVRAAAGGNTATNPRRAMDPNDETSFASLDQATGKNELQLILPNLGELGRIESVEALVAFQGNGSNTHNLRVNAFTPGVGAGGSPPASFASTGTTPQIQRVTWPTAYYHQGGNPTWDFGGGGTIFDIRVDFVGGTTNKASIFWVVLVVKYRPQRSVVTPGKVVVRSPGGPRPPEFDPRDPFFRQSIRPRQIPATLRLDGQFYGNLKGYKDDGSGTFSGSANALLERPPDIVRHFLVTWAGISGSNLETGAGAVGSFVDLRALLRNAQPTDVKLACWIGERSTVQRVVQKMAEQAGIVVYQDRYSDKWLAFAWKPGAAEDYGYKLSWYDVTNFKVEEVTVVETRRAIRVRFAFDHFRSKTLFEAYLNAAGSGQGVSLPTIRDQRLTVTANVNDDVDWKVGGSTFAEVLTPGTYVPIDLCSDLRSQMRSSTGNNSPDMGYGFTIKTGYNDKLDYSIPALATNHATLRAGDYTAEGLAIEVARAMNETPGVNHGRVFSCSYDHAANKFTISATGGNFQIDGSNGALGAATSAVRALGTFSQPAAATSITMTYPRYGDRFWFGTAATFEFLWATGASAATNAAALLGYEKVDSGVLSNHPATYSRGDRERLAATLDGYYDPREENGIVADWIRDELSAVELRNRIFDLTAKPRVEARFATFRLPDVRRMQAIEFQGDVDPFVPYLKFGTDGSWVGKPLRVLEVVDHLGPDFHTEIKAMEA